MLSYLSISDLRPQQMNLFSFFFFFFDFATRCLQNLFLQKLGIRQVYLEAIVLGYNEKWLFSQKLIFTWHTRKQSTPIALLKNH